MTELSQRLNQDPDQEKANLEMRKHHISTWRYRVYMFIILVIILMIEPMFTSSLESLRGKGAFSISLLDPVSMHTKRGEGGKYNDLEALQMQINEVENQIATTRLQIDIVQNLETPEKQNAILNCVNRGECDQVEGGLMNRIDLLRSFMMIDHLVSDKLDFDQKYVLRNINEFLITQVGRGPLVTVQNIIFGQPEVVQKDYHLYKVPVTLQVKYFVNNDFMTFLNNIETRIRRDLAVMWRIEGVNYDIVNYLDEQEVSMSLALYYINAPKPLVQETPPAIDETHAAAGAEDIDEDDLEGNSEEYIEENNQEEIDQPNESDEETIEQEQGNDIESGEQDEIAQEQDGVLSGSSDDGVEGEDSASLSAE